VPPRPITAQQAFDVSLYLIFRRQLRAEIDGSTSLPWTQAG
jgi:hypothetical protein